MDVLIGEGYAVPQQGAVVGFDNIDDGQYESSPLTTVAQPLGEQGALALDLLIDKLEGKDVPGTRQLGTVPVVRNSCGCLSPVILELSQPHVAEAGDGLGPAGIRSILPEWLQSDPAAAPIADAVSHLVTGDEFDEQAEETLLHRLEAILAQQIRTEEPLGTWHAFVSSLNARLAGR